MWIIYNREQFVPTKMGLFFNAFYFVRRDLARYIAEMTSYFSGKVLDIGCGTQPYRFFLKNCEYYGMELDTPENRIHKKADYFYDGKTIPFEDSFFDCIMMTEVLEHVFNPDELIQEIKRILKPGGLLLITVPLLWDEHEQPYDYGRYSSYGFKYLLSKHNFDLIEYKKGCVGVIAIFALVANYIYKIINPRGRLFRTMLLVFIISFVNLTGLLISWMIPKITDVYVSNLGLFRNRKG